MATSKVSEAVKVPGTDRPIRPSPTFCHVDLRVPFAAGDSRFLEGSILDRRTPAR